MRLHVGLLAPPLESVPPERYGGTERVVDWLARALLARGHEVVVFASGDSTVRAPLVPVVERALWRDERFGEDLLPLWTTAVGKAYASSDGLDLMHNHLDHLAFPAARYAPVPTVSTLHGRLDLRELRPLFEEFRELPLVSISDAQRRPVAFANWIATVPHGIPPSLYRPRYKSGRYLAFCGRIAPEKGLHRAIEVALACEIPLRIAARLPLPDQHGGSKDRDYFEACIRPALEHPLVEFVGELGERDKEELFANAMALLFPIEWPEPFGLVQIEALACGTPVLASPRGSTREIVEPGVNGALCRTTAEFVAAVREIETIDRRACRASFEDRFTSDVMAANYERVYEAIVGARALSSASEGIALPD